MAPTFQFGYGWEHGVLQVPLFDPQLTGEITSLISGSAHTGTYHVRQNGGGSPGQCEFDLTGLSASELWFGIWVHPYQADGQNENALIRFLLSTGQRHEIRLQTDDVWDTYINGVKQENGSITHGGTWHFIEIHLLIADSGTFELKIDGTIDTTFSGDTQPGASATIDNIEFRAQINDWDFDDITVTTVDYPGDIRYDGVVPDGNSTPLQWTASAGSNWQTIDERPASDSDFNSETTDAQVDKYTLADWSGSGKTPEFVTQHARLRKDEAAGHQVELIMDDGTESIGSPITLTTVFAQYARMLTSRPSSGAWTESDIDGLIIGQRAQIV